MGRVGSLSALKFLMNGDKMTNNIMLDLETFGTGPNSVIRSIGAVRFDEQGIKDSFDVNICHGSCLNYGLKVDQKTFEWWDCQSEEAQSYFENTEKKPLNDALDLFKEWLGPDAIVWGNGSDFDNVILSNAYNKVQKDIPWNFWNNRCYRTIKALNKDVEFERLGTYHNAVDDAKSQALHLIKILRNK